MQQSCQQEALALLELDSIARALVAQDAALKRAPVTILACAPVSAGKALLIFGGDVASTEASLAAADEVAGCSRIDILLLPGVHAQVLEAFQGDRHERGGEALAVLELGTASAAIESADAAVKAAEVRIGRMHLATGFGGKAYLTLVGRQCDVEAAVEAAESVAGERLTDQQLIAAPHAELDKGAFRRPWPVDPAG